MSKQQPKKSLKNAAILIGIAVQMGVIIYLFTLLGRWLDTTYNNGEKLYLIICTLAGVSVSLYLVVKQTNKIKH